MRRLSQVALVPTSAVARWNGNARHHAAPSRTGGQRASGIGPTGHSIVPNVTDAPFQSQSTSCIHKGLDTRPSTAQSRARVLLTACIYPVKSAMSCMNEGQEASNPDGVSSLFHACRAFCHFTESGEASTFLNRLGYRTRAMHGWMVRSSCRNE